MRADGRKLADIATALGVSKSSVSVWVRDVEFEPQPRRASAHRRPHAQHLAKLAEIEECDRLGVERIGELSDDAFLAAGAALYAGEGSKTRQRGELRQYRPGDDGVLLRMASALLRHRRVATACPRVSARRPRPRCGRDVLVRHHRRAARAVSDRRTEPKPDPSIRRAKHEYGCVLRRLLLCSRTLREILGLVRALLASEAIPG